jgi:hypothetical protein
MSATVNALGGSDTWDVVEEVVEVVVVGAGWAAGSGVAQPAATTNTNASRNGAPLRRELTTSTYTY